MRKRLLALLGLCLAATVVFAANHTISYTAGQDTIIQTRLIPAYNRQKCGGFGLTASCTSPQLTAAGCVVRTLCQASGLNPGSTPCTTLDGINVESCTIFTTNSAGQDAMMAEMLARQYLTTYQISQGQAKADFTAGFAAANATNQNAACNAVGLPNGCDGP